MGLQNLVVLYGVGGLSDVGRHAVLAALEKKDSIDHITVLTQYPELLQNDDDHVFIGTSSSSTKKNTNWNCGCENRPHTISENDKERITIVKIGEKSWNDVDLTEYIASDPKTTAFISCLGNRQPFFGYWDSFDGNNALIRAINNKKVIDSTTSNTSNTSNPYRVVVLTSCGINEDWPAFEFSTLYSCIMIIMFTIFGITPYNDLRTMELSYRDTTTTTTSIDYLFVRTLGLTEDIIPCNKWMIQREKYKHPLGIEIAKMDVARYMIEEAIHPTRSHSSVVIGSDPTIPLQRTTQKK